MVQCDPPEKRRELEGELRETVRSLAVRHVSLLSQLAEWESHAG